MIFRYKAYASNSKITKGDIEAINPSDAVRQLSLKNQLVFEIDEVLDVAETRKKEKASSFKLFYKKPDITNLFIDISVLLDAGMGLDLALKSISASTSSSSQRWMIDRIRNVVSAGGSARDGFSTVEGMAPDSLALIASGEAVGKLSFSIKKLAEDLKLRDEQKNQVSQSLVYPTFLLVMMIASILILTFVLVPALEPVFNSSNSAPPIIFSALSAVRQVIISYWYYVLIGIFGIMIVILTIFSQSTAKIFLRRVLLKLPHIGGVIKGMALSRYLNSLGMLLENGLPMINALKLSADCCTIDHYGQRLEQTTELVLSGERLPEALAKTKLFGADIISLIRIGDEVNELPTVITRAAGILSVTVMRKITRFQMIFTPAITILMGILIGSLIISVMTALLGINELALQ